jgi:hypothetical protein
MNSSLLMHFCLDPLLAPAGPTRAISPFRQAALEVEGQAFLEEVPRHAFESFIQDDAFGSPDLPDTATAWQRFSDRRGRCTSAVVRASKAVARLTLAISLIHLTPNSGWR